MGRALVRRPSPRLSAGIVTHRERHPVDAGLALGQWRDYVAALGAAGLEPIEVEQADDCPDGVFVEDTLVVRDGLAVLTLPGAEARRRETGGVGRAVIDLGYEVRQIEEPGTLDGGDVLAVGETLFVGTGGRTNREGARQLRALLGAPVVEVPVAGALHLKSSVTALPDGTVVGYPPLVSEPGLFRAFRPVPEESGAQVVVLGERRVLVAADCPRSVELLLSLGLEPVAVEIGEFQKLEGCVTCLSVLLNP
jgi:dimethylargininase